MQQQWQIFRFKAAVFILIGMMVCGFVCAADHSSANEELATQHHLPPVVLSKSDIPYASEPDFKATKGINGSAYVPEHIPDVLQPMGLRPKDLLMRQIKTIPREKVKPINISESKSVNVDNAEMLETNKAQEKKPEETVDPRIAEEDVERSLEPFLKWLETKEAQDFAEKQHEQYKHTHDLKPSYDKANRVFFEMRFPYSGVGTSNTENGKSAVTYTTPSKK